MSDRGDVCACCWNMAVRMRGVVHCLVAGWLAAAATSIEAEEWTRFRGPNGAGVSESKKLPTTWSESKNLRWKCELPGPGSSSVVAQGDRLYVTCYSGYGVPGERGGALSDLKRHLVCIDRKTGQISWTKTVLAGSPEDASQGYLNEHGYASNTPVVDADRVYCFFGKAGVHAFDHDGAELWRLDVGKESSNRAWGSGSSLIRHEELVVVNASEESQSIRGIDARTGKEVWKAAASSLELAYGTPVISRTKQGRTDIVLAVPGEVWGLNPQNGKLTWFAEHSLTGNISPSVVVDGESLYLFGGFRSSGSLAVRAGGMGDVTKSHIAWTSRSSSYVATPALWKGHLYWVDDRGQAYCIEAATGKEKYRQRVEGLDSGGRPVYASPLVADGKLYIPTRWNGTLVLPAEPKYTEISRNRFESDSSDFNASPAVVGDALFLRSNRAVYCVAAP